MAHILVIEDDGALRAILVKFLERFGHMVSQAANGNEGLRLFRHKPIDLVITDIFMPETDGLEVILAVRKDRRDPPDRIPLIAMSGGMTTRDAKQISYLKQAELFGADRLFSKPFNFLAMMSAVQELLPTIAVA